jgi:hypothetical protein
MMEPAYSSLAAVALAWSAPTNGAVTGDLILAPLKASLVDGPQKFNQQWEEYTKKWSGKLRGKIVLLTEPKPLRTQSNAPFHRYTDAELSDIGKAPDPATAPQAKNLDELKWPEDPAELNKLIANLPDSLFNQIIDLMNQISVDRGSFFSEGGCGRRAFKRREGRRLQVVGWQEI